MADLRNVVFCQVILMTERLHKVSASIGRQTQVQLVKSPGHIFCDNCLPLNSLSDLM